VRQHDGVDFSVRQREATAQGMAKLMVERHAMPTLPSTMPHSHAL
jgi:hypothetical protein